MNEEEHQKKFEAMAGDIDFSKYSDMECLLMEIPEGTYINEDTQQRWEYYMNVFIVANAYDDKLDATKFVRLDAMTAQKVYKPFEDI